MFSINIGLEVLINKFAQNLINIVDLFKVFNSLNNEDKRSFLRQINYYITQSKPVNDDIRNAIEESGLRLTYTPCILLIKNGVADHSLNKIANLPNNELEKAFILLLHLFKVAYQRRFNAERNSSTKWWYWDLSDEELVEKIISTNGNTKLINND